MNNIKIEKDIKALIEQQKLELIGSIDARYAFGQLIEDVVFSENDVVDTYLRDNDIEEGDVALDLRDMQHDLVRDICDHFLSNELQK